MFDFNYYNNGKMSILVEGINKLYVADFLLIQSNG